MCWKIKKNHNIPWLKHTHENDIIYQLLHSQSGNQVMSFQTHQQTHLNEQQSVNFTTNIHNDIENNNYFDIDSEDEIFLSSKVPADEIVTV